MATTTATEAAPPPLAENEFLHLMSGMQIYYTQAAPIRGAVPASFILPAHVAALALHRSLVTVTATRNTPVEPRVIAQPTVARVARPVVSTTQRDTLDFIETHRRTVTAALGQVHGPDSTAAFVRAMQALERREQVEQAARIAAMYRGLVAVGQAHPGARPGILVISNHTGGFLQGLIGGCHDVLHGVVAEVEQAGHAVEHAAGAVAQWAGHAAQSVGRFFSSLF